MFLKLLKKDEQKDLFMQLAHVIAIADEYTVVKNKEENLEGMLGILAFGPWISDELKFINESESHMLELFLIEMSIDKKLFDWERQNLKIFEQHFGLAVERISSLPDVRKKVMLSLAESDVDLTTLDLNRIEEELLNITEFRSSIFSQVVKLFIKGKEQLFSASEKKAIVFELVGIALSDNDFSEVELTIVKSVAECFNIDSETFNEISELVKKLNNVSIEALELIQE